MASSRLLVLNPSTNLRRISAMRGAPPAGTASSATSVMVPLPARETKRSGQDFLRACGVPRAKWADGGETPAPGPLFLARRGGGDSGGADAHGLRDLDGTGVGWIRRRQSGDRRPIGWRRVGERASWGRRRERRGWRREIWRRG